MKLPLRFNKPASTGHWPQLVWGSGLLICLLTMIAVVVTFLPASWLADEVLKRTEGRIVLAYATGTVWRGEAMLGLAEDGVNALTEVREGRRKRLSGLVLPGLLRWQIDPIALLSGRLRIDLQHTETIPQPFSVEMSQNEVKIAPGSVNLPAELMIGLGTPFNTFKPRGAMRLSWDTLTLPANQNGAGTVTIELDQLSTSLSPISPLGSYTARLILAGKQLEVTTRTGALLVVGQGSWASGSFQFEGTASAAKGYETALNSLLGLLGRRIEQNAVALKF